MQVMNKALQTFTCCLLLNFTMPIGIGLAEGKIENYFCDPREPAIRVFLQTAKNFNTLVIGSEVFVLEQVSSSNNHQRFSITLGKNFWQVSKKNGHVSVQKNGIPRLNCGKVLNLKSTQSDYENNTGYVSTGGNVYDGPTHKNQIVDKLADGYPVYLSEQTGIVKGEFEWFEIEYADEKFGYMLGEDICSKSEPIKGIRRVCK